MKTRMAAIGMCIFLMVLSVTVITAYAPYQLAGHAYNETGSPMVGVGITITNERTGEQLSNMSVAGGEYQEDAANFPSGYENGDALLYYSVYGDYEYLNITGATIDTGEGGIILDIYLAEVSTCQPRDPNPPDGETGVNPQKTMLSWKINTSCPYNETLKYNVKFYRVAYNMQMKEFVSEGQSERSWNPYVMFYNTKYYWQITAIGLDGTTNTSEFWTFTTRDLGADAIEDKNYSKPFEDTFGTMNFSILQISDGVQAVFNNAIPAGLFYLFIFGMFFVGIYIRQGDVAIPALLGIILSPAIWTFVPMEYQGVTFWLLALSVGGILAAVFKSRL